jgi:hypothetical protein
MKPAVMPESVIAPGKSRRLRRRLAKEGGVGDATEAMMSAFDNSVDVEPVELNRTSVIDSRGAGYLTIRYSLPIYASALSTTPPAPAVTSSKHPNLLSLFTNHIPANLAGIAISI